MDNLECEWLFTLEATVFDSHGVGIVITGKMTDEHILLLSDTQLIKSWIFFFFNLILASSEPGLATGKSMASYI